MKNVLNTSLALSMVAILVFATGFVSCSDDDDNNDQIVEEALVIEVPLEVGETLPLEVTLASGAPVGEDVIWSSSDETRASVDRVTGVVTARSAGRVGIECALERLQNRRIEVILRVSNAP